MVCFYFLILIPLITATKQFDGPSYRSNVMEGDKPILRMSLNADYSESNFDEGSQATPPPETKDPILVRDLSLLVSWLVENYNYSVVPLGRKNNNGVKESGKAILRMLLSDTTDSDSDEIVDKVTPKTEITESLPLTDNTGEALVESPVESKNLDEALRTKHKTIKDKEEEPNPKWVNDLKEFIKDLTTRYGQHEVLEHAKPVIATLEKKHNMKIKDIDGEILITYAEKGKDKKTSRKRKKLDET